MIASISPATIVFLVSLFVSSTGQGEDEEGSQPRADLFGHTACGLDDVDGDDVPDLAVGNPRGDAGRGEIWFLSGADGSVIRRIEDGAPGGKVRIGWQLERLGDVDEDGRTDFLSLCLDQRLGYSQRHDAHVEVRSGSTGEALFSVPGLELGPVGDWDEDGRIDFLAGRIVRSGRDGSALANLSAVTKQAIRIAVAGDCDGDGRADFACIREDTVEILSGRSQEILHVLEPGKQRRGRRQGTFAVRAAGDLDADGRGDVLVSDIRHVRKEQTIHGWVSAWSGRSGERLFLFDSGMDDYGARERHDLVSVGDCSGDDVPDFVCTGNIWSQSVGLYSGANGRAIHTFRGHGSQPYVFSATALGDVDGDGVPEIAIGQYKPIIAGKEPGRLRVYSGGSGELRFELSRKELVAKLGEAANEAAGDR